MAAKRTPANAVDRLVADLMSPAAGQVATLGPDPLAGELAAWLATSAPFRAFAHANREKIRKKLRISTDAEARQDVRAELLVARLLLADRHIELAFEPGGARRGGPDFAVRYRGGRPFHVEVTRVRRADDAGPTGAILAKLRQLPAGASNVILLVLPRTAASPDIASAVRAIRFRADAKEEDFFIRRGFAGTRDFYDRFLRLGAVITWSERTDEAGRAEAWTNGSARIPISDRALRACLASLSTTAER